MYKWRSIIGPNVLEYDPTAKINDLVTKSERMDEIKGGNRLETLEDSLEAYKYRAPLHSSFVHCFMQLEIV